MTPDGNALKIVAAMSGGVDSSVAAAMLVREGYDVIGVTFRMWPKEECGASFERACCNLEAVTRARAAADDLKIPYYVLDFSSEFKKEVIDYFSKEYCRARTPNPCIVCNEKIKFKALLKKAQALGASFIATGHYARVSFDSRKKRYILKQGKDEVKDQSYVLFGLTQKQLSKVIFPLGGYCKKDIREISKKLKLRTSDKKESQEICFIWDNNYPEFLKKHYSVKARHGNITDEAGKIIGKHPGFMFFTIGQRKGLNLGGNKEPHYVIRIDAKNNRIIAGPRQALEKNALLADRVNWIRHDVGNRRACSLQSPIKVKAKIRYNHPKANAIVYPQANNCVKVVFDKNQSAVTPGQAVVFYKGDEVLGGGWIR